MVFSAKVVITLLAWTAKYHHSRKLGYGMNCFELQTGTQHSLKKAEVEGTLPKEVLGIQKNWRVFQNRKTSLEMLFTMAIFDCFTIYLHTNV